ncbi:integrase [Bacillus stercoris]|uniref:phage lytic cycle repressor MrpR family protein n=1 Tax=Bacillus stercoris TaxID=2054641 RepID=UPI003CED7878
MVQGIAMNKLSKLKNKLEEVSSEIKNDSTKMKLLKQELGRDYQFLPGYVQEVINNNKNNIQNLSRKEAYIFSKMLYKLTGIIALDPTNYFTINIIDEFEGRKLSYELYNATIKEKFLERYDKETTKHYYRLKFRDFSLTEKILDKDIFNFSLDELRTLFFDLDSRSLESIRGARAVIGQYTTWAINNGLAKSNINKVYEIREQDLKQFIDKNKKTLFTDKEVEEFVNYLFNHQDKAMVQAVYEGIDGYEHSELINLTIDDLLDNNKVRLKDDKHGERIIKVSEKCHRLLRSAYEQNVYHLNNGASTNKLKHANLVRNDHVFRLKYKSPDQSMYADKHLVHRSFKNFQKIFEEKYFTPKILANSGKLNMAYQIYKEKKELTVPDYKKITAQYGFLNENVRFASQSLRKVVNMENIEKYCIQSEEISE